MNKTSAPLLRSLEEPTSLDMTVLDDVHVILLVNVLKRRRLEFDERSTKEHHLNKA